MFCIWMYNVTTEFTKLASRPRITVLRVASKMIQTSIMVFDNLRATGMGRCYSIQQINLEGYPFGISL